MIERFLKLGLPEGQSLFLWGARKTGKSTYLKQYYPDSFWVDLLKNDVYLHYFKSPHVLREEIMRMYPVSVPHPIIIDEVQKIPALLDEIHWLIENGPKGCSFILCGSSLRRLKHEGANLLGGRAWRQIFMPLCYPELPSFDLLRILNHGLLPDHYLRASNPTRLLESYLVDYLIPEVQWESRIRQLGSFGRFLEAVAFSNGEILNSSNIARESGVSVKTVQSYVDLLVDMLIGYLVYPHAHSLSRQMLSATPKFYFFDPGLVRLLRGQGPLKLLKGPDAGHAFEHYVFLELLARKELTHARWDIRFWRTKTGLEVDFLLDRGMVAIETKIGAHFDKSDYRGLLAYGSERPEARLILVCLEPRKRLVQDGNQKIEIYPIEDFLSDLWSGKIISSGHEE